MSTDQSALQRSANRAATTLRGTHRSKLRESYHTILENRVAQAQEELECPAAGSAGLDLGYDPLPLRSSKPITRTESMP